MEVNWGPTRGLLDTREPVVGRSREPVGVPPRGTIMEPLCGVREPVEGRPRALAMRLGMDTAKGLLRWLPRGLPRRLVSALFCVMGSSMLTAVGLSCGLVSMSAVDGSPLTPTSSVAGSLAAAGAWGRKAPGRHREALRPQVGPRERAFSRRWRGLDQGARLPRRS